MGRWGLGCTCRGLVNQGIHRAALKSVALLCMWPGGWAGVGGSRGEGVGRARGRGSDGGWQG